MSTAVSVNNESGRLRPTSFRLYWLRHLMFFVLTFQIAILFWEIALHGFNVFIHQFMLDTIGMLVANAVLFWFLQVVIIFWIRSIQDVRPEFISVLGASVYATLASLCDAMVQWMFPVPVVNGNLPSILITFGLFAVVVVFSASVVVMASRRLKSLAA